MTSRFPLAAALAAAVLVAPGCSGDDHKPFTGPVCSGTPATLSTTTLKGNEQHGNMFDVVATSAVVVTGLTASLQSGNTNVTIEIYERAGTHVGHETVETDWTFAGSAVINGATAPTPVPVALAIPIGAGETHAFYVTTKGGTAYVDYTDGSYVGAVAASDPYIDVLQGTGNAYPFGSVFSPRIYNGTVSYTPCP